MLREGSAGLEGKDGPIRLLHPSLYNFFMTHARSHFQIDVPRQHHTLAIRCLHVMNSELKFDICEIGSQFGCGVQFQTPYLNLRDPFIYLKPVSFLIDGRRHVVCHQSESSLV